MKFIEYNPVEEKGNCIIRAFSKLLDKNYTEVKEELLELTKKLNCSDYREIIVFEAYLKNNNVVHIDNLRECKIKELKLPSGNYAIFCWDKNNFYHMVTLKDDKIYDKDERCFELFVLKIYKCK